MGQPVWTEKGRRGQLKDTAGHLGHSVTQICPCCPCPGLCAVPCTTDYGAVQCVKSVHVTSISRCNRGKVMSPCTQTWHGYITLFIDGLVRTEGTIPIERTCAKQTLSHYSTQKVRYRYQTLTDHPELLLVRRYTQSYFQSYSCTKDCCFPYIGQIIYWV